MRRQQLLPQLPVHDPEVSERRFLISQVTKRVSASPNLSADALFLTRKGDRLHRLTFTDPDAAPLFPYALDGSGNGGGGTFGVVLGVLL